MRIKTVMNHNQNDGLLKMIRRTDPMIYNRHDNLGLEKDIINSKLLNLIDQNYNNYHEGDNTFVVKVNGIDKILRVHLNNGTISSFNFMNWNGNKPRSATPVRNLPNQWW